MEDDEERPESRSFSRGGYYPTEDIALWMNVEAYILKSKSSQNFLIGSVGAVFTLTAFGVSIHSNIKVHEDVATISTILLFLFFFYTVYSFYKSFVYFVQGEQHTKNSDMPDSFRGKLRMYFCSMILDSGTDPEIPTVPTTIQLLETEIKVQPGPSNVPTAAERAAQHGPSMELEPEQGTSNVAPSPQRPRGRSMELLVPGQVPSGETPSPQRSRGRSMELLVPGQVPSGETSSPQRPRGRSMELLVPGQVPSGETPSPQRVRQGRSLDLIPEQEPSTSSQTLFARLVQSVRSLPHHRSDVLHSNVVHPFVPHPMADRNSFPQYRGQDRTNSLPQFPEGASQRQARFPVDRAIWVPPRGATDPEQQSRETEDKRAEGL